MRVAFFIFNMCFIALLTFCVSIGAMEHNLLSFPIKQAKEIQALFPQGWAFFTKDPRSEQLTVFQKKENRFIRLNIKNSAEDLGISRKSRLLQLGLASIAGQIDSIKWVAINNAKELDTFMQYVKPIDVYNLTQVKSVKGEIVLLKTRPVPWAWLRSSKEVFMPRRGIKVKIKN